MLFARTVTVVPLPGRQAEAERLLEERLDCFRLQKGFILGMRLHNRRKPDEVGSMSLWETREDANRVAATEHLMSLNSRLNTVAKAGKVEWGSAEVCTYVSEAERRVAVSAKG